MSLVPENRKFQNIANRSSFARTCSAVNGGPSNSFREETSAVRPRKLPYKPVIGELENRKQSTVPVTFDFRGLDIRLRLPDRKGKGSYRVP